MLNKIKRYSKGLQKRIIGVKYGETWKGQGKEFYDELFRATPLIHEDFLSYMKTKNNIKTVIEIGCGAGVYPINHSYLFKNMEYTGIDISGSAIDFCKKNSTFEFHAGDFLKMDFHKKYDLVFSHSVIDHVYDIDLFLTKITQICKKYAYVFAYRGFYPDLQNHKMTYASHQGCYHNELSVNKVKSILNELGLSKDEYTIEPKNTGYLQNPIGTLITINKKQNS